MESIIAEFVKTKEAHTNLLSRRAALMEEKKTIDAKMSHVSGEELGITLLHHYQKLQQLQHLADAKSLWESLITTVVKRFAETRPKEGWIWLEQNIAHIHDPKTWEYFVQMWTIEGTADVSTQVTNMGPPYADPKFTRLFDTLRDIKIPCTFVQKYKMALLVEDYTRVRDALGQAYSSLAAEVGSEFFDTIRNVVPHMNTNSLQERQLELQRSIGQVDAELGSLNAKLADLKVKIGV